MRAPLLFLVLAASGLAAELHLDSAAVEANKPAKLSLQLQSGESELTGLQFDVEYDASRFDLKLEIGPAAEEAVKVLQSNTLQPGKVRVLIFGFNRNKIADGVVAFVHISQKSDAAADDSYPIRISEPAGTSGEGVAVAVRGTAGNVTTGRGKKSPARSEAR